MGQKGRPSVSPRRRQGQSGQVAILFALVFTFLFILFGFVIDFAHLINTKINMQIAADSAAYAGAAWQARLLNRIGMANYKIRQDIKEFSMRVNVTHLRHNRNYPRGGGFVGGGHQRHRTEPFMCQQAHGYQAISGLRYAQDTNLCKNASPSTGGLPPIVVPPVIAKFDPFAVAIAAQIRRIQQEANRECRAAAGDNRQLAQYMINAFTRRSQFHATQVRNMVNFMNEAARERDMSGSDHPIVRAAYQSALRNLTRASTDGLTVELLQPSGGQFMDVEEARIRGSIFVMNFQVVGNGCVGQPGFVNFNNMSAGFEKVPSVLTYFAVKVTAQPRLFFMPANWVQAGFPRLEAISAAKPFGSRIGPLHGTDNLLPIPNRPGNQSRLVNFKWTPNDGLGMTSTKRLAYLDALHPRNGIGRPDGNRDTGWPRSAAGAPARQALQAIRAPTLFDAIFYPIFPDPGPNAGQDYPETNEFAMALYPDYLEAANHANDSIITTPTPATPGYLPVTSRNRGFAWIQVNANNTGAGGPYGGYLEESPSSHSITSALGLPRIGSQAQANAFGWASPRQIHSSWAPDGKPGRIGYSVKAVSFDGLMRSIRTRDRSGGGANVRIVNEPTGDENLVNILH